MSKQYKRIIYGLVSGLILTAASYAVTFTGGLNFCTAPDVTTGVQPAVGGDPMYSDYSRGFPFAYYNHSSQTCGVDSLYGPEAWGIPELIYDVLIWSAATYVLLFVSRLARKRNE